MKEFWRCGSCQNINFGWKRGSCYYCLDKQPLNNKEEKK